MTEAEHLRVARQLIEPADRLRHEGDNVAMAEMLWGAVNRVARALALQHGWARGNRLPRLGVVLHHLAVNHHTATDLRRGQAAANALHGHFYNSHLEPDDLHGYTADTQTLIADLLTLYYRRGHQ